MSLLGFRERKQDGPTTPWRGCSWGGRGGYMALGGGLGPRSLWLAGYTVCSDPQSALGDTRAGGAEDGQDAESWCAVPGERCPGPPAALPVSSASGPATAPAGAEAPRAASPVPTQGTGRCPRGNVQHLENQTQVQATAAGGGQPGSRVRGHGALPPPCPTHPDICPTGAPVIGLKHRCSSVSRL